MKFSMTGQDRVDILIQVTVWAGLTVRYFYLSCTDYTTETNMTYSCYFQVPVLLVLSSVNTAVTIYLKLHHLILTAIICVKCFHH